MSQLEVSNEELRRTRLQAERYTAWKKRLFTIGIAILLLEVAVFGVVNIIQSDSSRDATHAAQTKILTLQQEELPVTKFVAELENPNSSFSKTEANTSNAGHEALVKAIVICIEKPHSPNC